MNLDHLQGKELFKALKANKDSIIKDKQAGIKYTDSVMVSAMPVQAKREHTTKADGQSSSSESEDSIDVKVVCNTAWFCDSHMDVLTADAYDASIAKRGNTIPHIADHKWTSTSHVGDVNKVYVEDIELRTLGIEAEGSTSALIMETSIRKDYNKDVFKFYSNGKINQHSIGLTYGKLMLALNSDDPEDAIYKDVWDKNYSNIINKELVDKRGYFWLVPEVDVLENSCVLFGANGLTPTLSTSKELSSLQTDSPLGNIPETQPVQQQSIGKTMNLEEAQGKIISLTQELAEVKGALATAKVEATSAEKARITGILKAQATFGSDAGLQKAALSYIEKGLDVDTAIVSFEVIKESIQSANHVDTSGAGDSLKQDKQEPKTPKTFGEELSAGLDAMKEQPQMFGGIK